MMKSIPAAPASSGHPEARELDYIEIRIHGKSHRVPSAQICGRTTVVTGRWLKMATVMDEELVEGEVINDLKPFIAKLKASRLKADVFTFTQKVLDGELRYTYPSKWENAAVVPITSYQDWLKNRAEYDVRKAVKKAGRLGVTVRTAEFDDAFVRGIMEIYNDTPIRQGKPFWHYQKDFETVKLENATYLERSEFIGAYYQDELIGFIKMVYVDRIATTIQVISKASHYDKKSTNALIAKAVEICEQKGITHLVYGSFLYNDPNSSLTEFKRRNGFEKMLFPRYFVPLTLKGKVALKLGLHRGVKSLLPTELIAFLLRVRARFNNSIMRGLKSKL